MRGEETRVTIYTMVHVSTQLGVVTQYHTPTCHQLRCINTLTLDAYLVNHRPHLSLRSRRITSSSLPSSKMAQSQTPITPAQTMRKLEQVRYTATDVRWGMALDLSGADHQSLIAYGFHGQENQQARVSPSFFPPPFPSAATTVQEKLIVAFAVTSTRSPGPRALWRGLTMLQIYLHRHVRVLRTVVGVSSLRCRFHHRQRL